jgi:hypothetical protein
MKLALAPESIRHLMVVPRVERQDRINNCSCKAGVEREAIEQAAAGK